MPFAAEALGSDVAVFDICNEWWLDLCCLCVSNGLGELHFGLTTVSSWFLNWLEAIRQQPVPSFPIGPFLPFPEVERGDAYGIFHEPADRKFALLDGLIFSQDSWCVRTLRDDAFAVQFSGMLISSR